MMLGTYSHVELDHRRALVIIHSPGNFVGSAIFDKTEQESNCELYRYAEMRYSFALETERRHTSQNIEDRESKNADDIGSVSSWVKAQSDERPSSECKTAERQYSQERIDVLRGIDNKLAKRYTQRNRPRTPRSIWTGSSKLQTLNAIRPQQRKLKSLRPHRGELTGVAVDEVSKLGLVELLSYRRGVGSGTIGQRGTSGRL